MVKINQLKACPSCQQVLPDPIPPICPGCREVLVKAKDLNYISPNYLWDQHKIAQTVAEKSATTRKVNEETVSNKEELKYKATMDLAKWVRSCPDHDRISSAEDTHLFVQHIMYSGMSNTARNEFLGICVRIGEIAKHTLAFLEAKGVIDVRNNQTATRDGEMGEK